MQLSEAEGNNSNNSCLGEPPRIVGVCPVLVMFTNLASYMPDKRYGVPASTLGYLPVPSTSLGERCVN